MCWGVLTAGLLVEAGVRLAYDLLPDSAQFQVSRVRLWGIAGPRLASDWTETCVGDDHLGARILPDLDEIRVRFGPALYRVSTGSLGFSDVGFRTTDSTGVWDAVVVGDSFAFCHHVDIEDCWVPQLARETGLAIADLGVPGTGSVSHARYLEEYGRGLNPKLAIWQYWVNDPRDDFDHIVRGLVPCPRPQPAARSREIHPKQLLFDASVGASLLRATWRRHSSPASRVRTNTWTFETTGGRPLFSWKGEGAAPESKEGAKGMELTLAAIRDGARGTISRGGSFLLLVAPSNLQVYADELPTEELRNEMRAENRTSDRVVAFANEQGIDVLDLRRAFRAAAERGEDLYPSYDVHWTPQGNRLAASLAASWVRDTLGKRAFDHGPPAARPPADSNQ